MQSSSASEQVLSTIDVAQRYNISVRAIRWYEQRGLLSPLHLDGARVFRPDDCTRIELILKCKRLGFTLAEIHALLDRDQDVRFSKSQIETQLTHLNSQRERLDAAITELRAELQTLAHAEQ
jgi:DNA-binding transcriptional MerR regulator